MVIMKKIAYTLCILLCALACGCAPDGGGSPLRGQWVMVAMLSDDQIVETEASLYTWRFHSDIVQITAQKDWHANDYYTGIWTLTGQAFTIDFKGQAAPKELGLSSNEINQLTLTFETDSKIIISGPQADYFLKKLN